MRVSYPVACLLDGSVSAPGEVIEEVFDLLGIAGDCMEPDRLVRREKSALLCKEVSCIRRHMNEVNADLPAFFCHCAEPEEDDEIIRCV